jgi:hypothetical protein
MARTRREDCHISCPDVESAPFRSSESDPLAATSDAQNLVDARMIVDIIVDPVPPRVPPPAGLKKLFKYGRGIEALR